MKSPRGPRFTAAARGGAQDGGSPRQSQVGTAPDAATGAGGDGAGFQHEPSAPGAQGLSLPATRGCRDPAKPSLEHGYYLVPERKLYAPYNSKGFGRSSFAEELTAEEGNWAGRQELRESSPQKRGLIGARRNLLFISEVLA